MSHPSIFYKYTTASTAGLILENSKLRWSSPLIFNDIGEFQRMPCFDPSMNDAYGLLSREIASIVFDGKAIREESLKPNVKMLLTLARKLVADGMAREELIARFSFNNPGADDQVESTLRGYFEMRDSKKVRILCLSTLFDNAVMWAYYADANSGCVLGFRHLEERSTPLLEAKPVAYSKDRPVVGSGLDFLMYEEQPGLVQRTIQAVCYTKEQQWAAECEWRAIAYRSDEGSAQYSDLIFYPEELESVTIGVRATQETEEMVRQTLSVKYPNACLYRMEAVYGKLTRRRLP